MALIRQALGSIREPISQEALGQLIGFDKYKVSRIERGAQEMSRQDAIAIAAVDPAGRSGARLLGDGILPADFEWPAVRTRAVALPTIPIETRKAVPEGTAPH